jgi:hypothetical protein
MSTVVIQASTEIGPQDTGMARKQPKDSTTKVSDQELSAQPAGANGTADRLTELLLESALEGEITAVWATTSTDVPRRRDVRQPQRRTHQDGHHRHQAGRDQRAAGSGRRLRAEDIRPP